MDRSTTYICGYCSRPYVTWDDLIDHLINHHRCRYINYKLLPQHAPKETT